MKHIRNFSIIAHIDHGKSTLADRLLEVTGTIEKRKMKEQVLDSMELERERGITIKMQPARMHWKKDDVEYIVNLIDTPGHIDFSYEVSRALKAVEGVILLVDATQGIQAQTLTTLGMAEEQGLVVIPVLSKIDAPTARTTELREEMAMKFNVALDDVLLTSGKTGEGVATLLDAIIERVPPPKETGASTTSALVFDFQYSNHRGVIVYMRLFDGTIKKGDYLTFMNANESFIAIEVGVFVPEEKPVDSIGAGEIGYVVTGIKQPGVATVGDTIALSKQPVTALAGYKTPRPVVWASVYPESQDDFSALKQALDRLRLSDSSLTYEEETSGVLGRGFRCGFLGMLHLEIITERLRREFSLELIVTLPSIVYEVELASGKVETIYNPSKFPDHGMYKSVMEPWVDVKIITPPEFVGPVMQMLYDHEAELSNSEAFSDGRTIMAVTMPLREMMRNFFDKLKSISSGYASVSYEFGGSRSAEVTRLDVLIAEELVPAFSRVVSLRRVEEEATKIVERLRDSLPKQMFVTKIQAKAFGRIIAAERIAAMKKDVTGHLYGGDITRKMKLREKQKRGKKKMLERGKVHLSQDVFMKIMKGD